MASHIKVPVIVVLSLGFLSACELVSSDGNRGGAIFITQSAPQTVVMQALYEGSVSRQGDCLRLSDEPDGHTVVWPYGFRLSGSARDTVVDDEGRTVGKIGDHFRLGGGEVPTLWENGPVSEQDRTIALEECPGRYWIVGEIVR